MNKVGIRIYRDMSIKWKMTSIILIASISVLAFYLLTIVLYEITRFKDEVAHEHLFQAQIIGASSEAALQFNDTERAHENLSFLKNHKHIIYSAILKNEGDIFADYHKPGSEDYTPHLDIPFNEVDRTKLTSEKISLFSPILLENEVIGWVYIESNLGEFFERLKWYTWALTGMLLIAVPIAMVLSYTLQRFISLPIEELAKKALYVSDKKDYTIRASKVSDDEIGVLTDNFNEMLAQIEEKDTKLKNFAQRQEELVAKRTAELLESEERFRHLSEAAFEGVILHRSGKIIDANKAALDLFGYDFPEILGRNLLEFIDSDYHPLLVEKMNTDEDNHFEVEGIRKSGRRIIIEGRGTSGKYKEENVRIGTFRDITEQKKAEQERKNLEAQVQHAQKLKSLGILAGGIAHDFNNILMAILGNAELAMLDLELDSPAMESIKGIETAAKRAAELSQQMLAYSGKGKFIIETIDINTVIEEIGQLLDSSISKKIEVNYELSPNLPRIEVDVTQVRQVIMNLITNASEAIGDQYGSINIASVLRKLDIDFFRQSHMREELPEGVYVLLEVTDTGSGMSEETLEKLFDPFYTTKFTGRGLGMSAVLGIVRGHKGAIKVESAKGEGSSFKVAFPLAERPVKKETAIQARATTAWQGQGTVLLVDDEEVVRSTGAKMLDRLGFSVITAVDGVEALSVYGEAPERFDCVLLDLTMPRMDGVECFHQLRKLDDKVRIVVISGYSETEVTRKFKGERVPNFILKPFQMSDLKERMQDAMRKSL